MTFASPLAVQVVHTWNLGDLDGSGNPSPDAWKTVGESAHGYFSSGFNRDGLAGDDPAHCQPRAGADRAEVFANGPKGEDNAFAHMVLPVLSDLFGVSSGAVNAALAAGAGTWALDVENGIPGIGDAFDIVSHFYTLHGPGTPVPHEWRMPASEYNSVCILHFKAAGSGDGVQLAHSFGLSCPIDLLLAVGSGSDLRLHFAALDVRVITAGFQPGKLKGLVSGAIPTTHLTAEVKRFASTLSTSFCSGPKLDALLLSVAQASDVLVKGVRDPTVQCDAISMAFGFVAEPEKIVGTETSPPVNPCP